MHQSQMKTNINIVYRQRRATQNITVNQKEKNNPAKLSVSKCTQITYLQTIQFIILNYELDSFLVPNQLRNPNHLSAKIYFRKDGNMNNKKCHDCKKPIYTENRTEVRLPVKTFVCEDCAKKVYTL